MPLVLRRARVVTVRGGKMATFTQVAVVAAFTSHTATVLGVQAVAVLAER
tara:strand:- start:2793 stop:2942 length:150 start_codon:yes stop_codon:yes gene_type:complete